jgi:hypothetical protein
VLEKAHSLSQSVAVLSSTATPSTIRYRYSWHLLPSALCLSTQPPLPAAVSCISVVLYVALCLSICVVSPVSIVRWWQPTIGLWPVCPPCAADWVCWVLGADADAGLSTQWDGGTRGGHRSTQYGSSGADPCGT